MKYLTPFLLIIFLYSCNNSSPTNNKTEEKPKLTFRPLNEKEDEKLLKKAAAPLIIQGQYCFLNKMHPFLNINGKSYPFEFVTNIIYEGGICIDTKKFSGHSPYSIPFIAYIIGNVNELYVDGKKVNEYKGIEGEIFFRKKIALEMGYNRVSVKAIGKSGRATESYIEINIEETPEKIEIQTN